MNNFSKRNVAIIFILLIAIGWWFFDFKYKDEIVNGVLKENSDNVLEKSDLIVLESPKINEIIQSPLRVIGKARGNWFFEASFPVYLTNWDGLIIAEGIAQAKGEWMTENFVPFEATLNFIKPDYGERGTLILKKDNPSGLPEHDDALEIPISFE